MGYTHHYYQLVHCPDDVWATLREAARKLVAAAPCAIDDESDPCQVRFNGVGSAGCETFLLGNWKRPKYDWERLSAYMHDGAHHFCKTGHRPYDLVVCAVLAVAEQLAPDVYRVSSDGEPDKWQPGLAFATKVLGFEVKLPKGVAVPAEAVG